MSLVTLIWDAQEAARAALVSPELQSRATGGVHGAHDLVMHRPLVPGEHLQTWVDAVGARPAGDNVVVTLRYSTYDAADVLVAEQWWTTVFLGTTCDPVGDRPPDHTFPTDAYDRPAGVWRAVVDDAMPRRYAQVSGDWSPHHFDPVAARRTGFDRPFLHGLCVMALCARGITEAVAGGDPTQVQRVAVRFARPTFVGEQLEVRIYDAGGAYAFEAVSADAVVISHGRAELRGP
jgi:acyl dehydratase